MFRTNFARAIEAAARSEGPVVVHCAGGVNRTGLVCALLLRVAGVPIAELARDWAASERNWAPLVGDWIADAPDETERDKRRLLFVWPPEALADVLVAVEFEHGATSGYLRSAGVEAADLERVRLRLRS